MKNYLKCITITGWVCYALGVTKQCHSGTGRCFWVTDNDFGRLEWVESKDACARDGGNLATIETQELWDFVEENFQ